MRLMALTILYKIQFKTMCLTWEKIFKKNDGAIILFDKKK